MARNIATKTLAMRNDRPLVTFTFDDAPGLRLLSRRCTARSIPGPRHFLHFRRRMRTDESWAAGWLPPSNLKTLYAAGHEIGCHTFSHAAVAAIRRHALVVELERNRTFLQEIHHDLVLRNFAYPYGDLSFRAKQCLEAHFDSCRSLQPGVNVGVIDLGALKSCELQNSSIGRGGILDIIAASVRQKGWLIFVSHDVDNQPSRFGVSPDLLEFALNTAGTAQCRVVSVGSALQILMGGAARSSGKSSVIRSVGYRHRLILRRLFLI